MKKNELSLFYELENFGFLVLKRSSFFRFFDFY
jgi:hypothetical protein